MYGQSPAPQRSRTGGNTVELRGGGDAIHHCLHLRKHLLQQRGALLPVKGQVRPAGPMSQVSALYNS